MAELLGDTPVRAEWLPTARASACRYLKEQAGMRSVGAAITARARDGAFRRHADVVCMPAEQMFQIADGAASTPVQLPGITY